MMQLWLRWRVGRLECGFLWIIAIGILSGALGCGSQYGADVRGVVTADGQPLTTGTVAFHPVSSGTPAYGAIQSDGTYSVKTGTESGLVPGDYVVTVISREANAERPAGGGPPPPGKLLSPEKYGQKETSDLNFTIVKGRNEIPIQLIAPAKKR